MTGRVVTLGEGLGVLRTGEFGTLAQLSLLHVGTGGAEGNVAIGIARLGGSVTWLGRVGADGLGQRVVRELRAEGVDVIGIVDETAATGVLLKESPYPGSTVVTYHRTGSAGSRLRPADLEQVELTSDDILHLTGVTAALSPSALATMEAAVELARAAGALVSYDVNHRSKLWSARDAVPVHRRFAAVADLVFASDDEAAMLLDESGDVATLSAGLSALGADEVVITRGAAGAAALRDGILVEQPAVTLPTVVDSVGAGDAFVAAYLAELLLGAPVADRLLLGVRNGAAACLSPGDWEGAATRAQLDRHTSDSGSDPVSR